MAQGSIDETPKNRWWLKPLIVVLLLAVLAAAGMKVYRQVAPSRLATQARLYLANGDVRNALITAQRALEINPFSEDAARVMVEITEYLQVPDSVEWRRRVAELNPGSPDEALAWAGTALRMGRTATAEQALASVPESQRNSARFYSLSGSTAMAAGKWKEAAVHYAKALELDPNNELHQYNYALIQIQAPDKATREQGHAVLSRLGQSSQVKAFALRSIVARLIAERQFAEALQQSTQLQQTEGIIFPDRLTHLDLLAREKPTELPAALETVKSVASEDGDSAAAMINWLRINDRAADALAWAKSLNAEIGALPGVAAALADAFVSAGDWESLREHTGKGTWGTLEYVRLAFEARALRELNEPQSSKARWASAISLAARSRDSASRLAQMAARWGWQDETRDVLWAATNAPAPQWALQMLHRIYQTSGETSGMLRVAQRMLEAEPENDRARNNVAILSLLLNKPVEPELATAKALHEKHPEDGFYASTYAFALHRSGRTAEGVEVMKKISANQLQDPGIAVYYAILLQANGAKADAEKYAALAKRGSLLPEEKAMVDEISTQ